MHRKPSNVFSRLERKQQSVRDQQDYDHLVSDLSFANSASTLQNFESFAGYFSLFLTKLILCGSVRHSSG